jgi:hypothetical protein
MNKNRLKGSPKIILADCNALRASESPATRRAHATAIILYAIGREKKRSDVSDSSSGLVIIKVVIEIY